MQVHEERGLEEGQGRPTYVQELLVGGEACGYEIQQRRACIFMIPEYTRQADIAQGE